MNRRKDESKGGITLIELVISMAVFGTLLSISVKSFYTYKKYLNNVNVEYCNNSIMFLINKAKNYCRANNIPGNILFSPANNNIIFYDNSGRIDNFVLPSGFKLLNTSLPAGKVSMTINRNGITSDACTISYLDSYSIKHETTLCVGTAYVEIQY
jgi:prepilin-type N-terminal cleavage/methylation domain